MLWILSAWLWEIRGESCGAFATGRYKPDEAKVDRFLEILKGNHDRVASSLEPMEGYERGKRREKVLPPEDKHSSFPFMKGHKDILPGHSSVSLRRCTHLLLEKSMEKLNLLERTLARSKSAPEPPALKK